MLLFLVLLFSFIVSNNMLPCTSRRKSSTASVVGNNKSIPLDFRAVLSRWPTRTVPVLKM